jgi:uncharacterized membrane protein YccC
VEEQPTQAGIRPPMISLRDHPRASLSIRRAKARAGLAGFGIGALGAWTAGGDPFEMGFHALVGGIAAYLVVWTVALVVWRQVLLAQARDAVRIAVALRAKEAEDRRRQAAERAEQAAARGF